MNQLTDLWWESRQRTAAEGKPVLLKRLVTRGLSLAGRPTQRLSVASLTTGREKSGIVIDLNKYRPDRNLQKFVDAGVDAFALRMGGPGMWAMNNWRYTEDPTFRPYMEQLDKLGLLGRSIGYIIHNPFEIWKTTDDTHINLINQWTSGGYMPAHLTLDHEVSECWQNGTKIGITGYNLVGSMDAITAKMIQRFKRPVSIYSARWFLNKFGPEHTVYFDNVNRPELGMTRRLWLAWYPQAFSKEYPDFQVSLQELLSPNGTQRASYLYMGNYTGADLWQFSDRIKLPGDVTGVDCNVTMGTLAEFLTAFGMSAAPPIVIPPVIVVPPVVPAKDYRPLQDWLSEQVRVNQIHAQENTQRDAALALIVQNLIAP